jgi:FkbM family methyltransferase
MSKLGVQVAEPLTRRRIRHLGVTIHPDPSLVAAFTRAEMFWGLFERAECSYIRQHLRGSRYVIELGAGLGVSSTHIAAGLAPGGALICVEANAAFISAIRRNVEPYIQRSGSTATIINSAIGAHDGTAVLNVDVNPFASYVGTAPDPRSVMAIEIGTRSLYSIVEEHQPEYFDLVCDIEGAESEFIVSGPPESLDRCRQLIIELHDCRVGGEALGPEDLLQALRERWGFRVVARKGPVASLARLR